MFTHCDWCWPAGCVVANRLTKDSGTTVLLLEAGGPDTKPEIQVPVDWPKLWGLFKSNGDYLKILI
nr:GMC family oxidoreductase N-terminal domain-containing protein [Nostoc sp. LEGE 12450]